MVDLTADRVKQVKDYISKAKAKGYSSEQIVTALKNSGIDDKTIQSLMGGPKKVPFYKNPIFIGVICLIFLAGLLSAVLFVADEFDTAVEFIEDEQVAREQARLSEETGIRVPGTAECNYDIDCGSGYSCVSGQCAEIAPTVCGDLFCAPEEVGFCERDCPCIINTDCPQGHFCDSDGACRPHISGGIISGGGGGGAGGAAQQEQEQPSGPECAIDEDCGEGAVCSEGTCELESETTGLVCSDVLPTCADGVDNDGDSLFDLDDESCIDWTDDEGVYLPPEVDCKTDIDCFDPSFPYCDIVTGDCLADPPAGCIELGCDPGFSCDTVTNECEEGPPFCTTDPDNCPAGSFCEAGVCVPAVEEELPFFTDEDCEAAFGPGYVSVGVACFLPVEQELEFECVESVECGQGGFCTTLGVCESGIEIVNVIDGGIDGLDNTADINIQTQNKVSTSQGDDYSVRLQEDLQYYVTGPGGIDTRLASLGSCSSSTLSGTVAGFGEIDTVSCTVSLGNVENEINSFGFSQGSFTIQGVLVLTPRATTYTNVQDFSIEYDIADYLAELEASVAAPSGAPEPDIAAEEEAIPGAEPASAPTMERPVEETIPPPTGVGDERIVTCAADSVSHGTVGGENNFKDRPKNRDTVYINLEPSGQSQDGAVDLCFNSGVLQEATCLDNYEQKYYQCQAGCDTGKCKTKTGQASRANEITSCADRKSANVYIKESINTFGPGSDITIEDECLTTNNPGISSQILMETICTSDGPTRQAYRCAEGCNNGACIVPEELQQQLETDTTDGIVSQVGQAQLTTGTQFQVPGVPKRGYLEECQQDSQCEEGLQCVTDARSVSFGFVDGLCVQQCSLSTDCPDGFACYQDVDGLNFCVEYGCTSTDGRDLKTRGMTVGFNTDYGQYDVNDPTLNKNLLKGNLKVEGCQSQTRVAEYFCKEGDRGGEFVKDVEGNQRDCVAEFGEGYVCELGECVQENDIAGTKRFGEYCSFGVACDSGICDSDSHTCVECRIDSDCGEGGNCITATNKCEVEITAQRIGQVPLSPSFQVRGLAPEEDRGFFQKIGDWFSSLFTK